MNILLVEDDTYLSDIYMTKLKHRGHDVTLATDGEKAIESLGGGYDVILLDLMIPKVNGVEILRYMTENGVEIPTVVITCLEMRTPQRDIMKKYSFVKAYVMKDRTLPSYIATIVEKVHAGEEIESESDEGGERIVGCENSTEHDREVSSSCSSRLRTAHRMRNGAETTPKGSQACVQTDRETAAPAHSV